MCRLITDTPCWISEQHFILDPIDEADLVNETYIPESMTTLGYNHALL